MKLKLCLLDELALALQGRKARPYKDKALDRLADSRNRLALARTSGIGPGSPTDEEVARANWLRESLMSDLSTFMARRYARAGITPGRLQEAGYPTVPKDWKQLLRD